MNSTCSQCSLPSADDDKSCETPPPPTITTTTTESATVEYDWVGETVIGIASACNLCGTYDMQQVGFEQQEQMAQQQQKQSSKKWNRNDWEVSLYQKFLFDESSIRLDE